MTVARSHFVSPEAGGCYHCIQRCVRRAFLCGEDHYSGRSFEHRKAWIEDRLRHLSHCFAIAVHAYAVMSNHLHIVVQFDPAHARSWSDEEVATRWVRLFPPPDYDDALGEIRRQHLLANPARLDVVRARLGDLSWFMRCLAEPIARRANREDGCKGRFWEGRFKCQVLCDERALLAAMAYVDLNPIRAGLAERLDDPVHTSGYERIVASRKLPEVLAEPLRPIMGMSISASSLSSADYLQLLDWTGRELAPGRRSKISERAPAVLSQVDRSAFRWVMRVRGYGGGWGRVAGSAQDLVAWAERLGQRWLRGIRLASLLT